LGEANIGGQAVKADGWAECVKAFKGGAGAILDAPALKQPLYLLPQDSPHLKAGDGGKAPGAQLPPFQEWSEMVFAPDGK
jgi:hypothetical protein